MGNWEFNTFLFSQNSCALSVNIECRFEEKKTQVLIGLCNIATKHVFRRHPIKYTFQPNEPHLKQTNTRVSKIYAVTMDITASLSTAWTAMLMYLSQMNRELDI
jgi:hypothetical protein